MYMENCCETKIPFGTDRNEDFLCEMYKNCTTNPIKVTILVSCIHNKSLLQIQ